MNPLALIPAPYRLLALAALAAALIAFGWVKGASNAQDGFDKLLAKQAQAEFTLASARQAVTAKVDLKFAPQLVKIETITKTIIKKVPTYVPATACPLPSGFRVLHDAAATSSELPDTPSQPDAAPVAAQDAAVIVTENYGICNVNAKRLEGLQEWVTEQLKLNPATP